MKTLPKYIIVLLVISFSSTSYSLTCNDIRGAVVVDFPDNTINDVAIASLAPDGSPIIRYNTNVLSMMSPQTRDFFYAHECGHHALGHNFGTTHPLAMEQAADCFAINKLYELGTFSGGDIQAVQNDIARFGVADWTHLPGPQRALNLGICLQQGGSACREVTIMEMQTTLVWQTIVDRLPCQHCIPWWGCQHPFDDVPRQVQVPITQQVPVTSVVCN